MASPLLPIGCYDLLPPTARQHADLASQLLQLFESYGYQQVAPSLLEYSDNILAGRDDLSAQLYRVMDGSSHKVLGIRPDITLQIARLAASRMSESPRPLRVSYNGLVLRKPQGQLETNRQWRQAGIELIGADSPEADAEVIAVAVDALHKLGITEMSVDLNLPGITTSIMEMEKLSDNQRNALLDAIAHKDMQAIKGQKADCSELLAALLRSAGDAHSAILAMETLDLPVKAKNQLNHLKQVVELLRQQQLPGCGITVDATDGRGLNYHHGIGFSVFVMGISQEVGRGGRYRIQDGQKSEYATGFTLYVETLSAIVPPPHEPIRVWVPQGTACKQTAGLRANGYVTVHALPGQADDESEACRHGCSHIYVNGTIKEIETP
ncbi:MAG: ATP phosphoribosyltransferase regulatory subunit [Alphaproteobacteria bacterium]